MSKEVSGGMGRGGEELVWEDDVGKMRKRHGGCMEVERAGWTGWDEWSSAPSDPELCFGPHVLTRSSLILHQLRGWYKIK